MNLNNNTCANCQSSLHGDYCHHCGEQILDDNNRSIKFLAETLTSEMTSLDGKLFSTLKLFFFKPGQQVRDFHLGIRKRYFSLISLFFIFNLLYFVISPMTDFNLSLREQLGQPYAELIRPSIENKTDLTSEDFKNIEARYNNLSATVAKSLIILSVPILAIFIALLNYNRRYYLQDHVLFSLNLYAFIIIWPIICKYGLLAFAYLLFLDKMPWSIYSTMLTSGLLCFTWLAQKNAYDCSKLEASLKLIPLIALLLVSHIIYRYIQFWLTWWQLSG